MSLAADPGRRWSEHWGWMAALLIAAILQGIVAWRSPLVARDGIDFIRYAQGLPEQGRELIRVKDQHPGYPLLILECAALVRPWVASETQLWIIAARIPSLALGLGSVAVVWLLARRLFDRWTADLAALICAVMPIFRQNAADALTDSPHMFFYLLATWLACEGLTRMSWPWWAGAGAASSL
ncbi:MAG: glycosyltransferase family 39 protein, partial [Planctomycetaceae bacterium]|nr:glycosyltransferase family 39 protein [Planctomycetaceae bacterium]